MKHTFLLLAILYTSLGIAANNRKVVGMWQREYAYEGKIFIQYMHLFPGGTGQRGEYNKNLGINHSSATEEKITSWKIHNDTLSIKIFTFNKGFIRGTLWLITKANKKFIDLIDLDMLPILTENERKMWLQKSVRYLRVK